jgi:hypothetical protein
VGCESRVLSYAPAWCRGTGFREPATRNPKPATNFGGQRGSRTRR